MIQAVGIVVFVAPQIYHIPPNLSTMLPEEGQNRRSEDRKSPQLVAADCAFVWAFKVESRYRPPDPTYIRQIG